jgi:hypothetical protein
VPQPRQRMSEQQLRLCMNMASISNQNVAGDGIVGLLYGFRQARPQRVDLAFIA